MPKKILIVEDEFIIAKVIEMHLQQAGYHVIGVACDFKTAKKLCTKKPDLVIMDIQLQNNEDGTVLAAELCRSNPVPIIYSTGNSDKKTREKAENSPSFTDFLVKPVNKETLLTAITNAIGEP